MKTPSAEALGVGGYWYFLMSDSSKYRSLPKSRVFSLSTGVTTGVMRVEPGAYPKVITSLSFVTPTVSWYTKRVRRIQLGQHFEPKKEPINTFRKVRRIQLGRHFERRLGYELFPLLFLSGGYRFCTLLLQSYPLFFPIIGFLR